MKNRLSRRKFIKQSAITAGLFTIVPRFVLGKGYLPPSDKITVGLIGCGRQRNVANRFISKTKEVEIVACSDLFAAKMEEFKRSAVENYAEYRDKPDYKGIATYLNYEEILERSDVDAVIIATPDHWHAISSIQAMEKGKDVYCEKPLSHTIKEGRAMAVAAQKYNRVLATGSMQRSSQKFLHACELVRNGYIGEVKKVLVNVGDPAIPYDLEAEPIPNGFDWEKWCGPAAVGPYNSLLAPPQNEGLKYWPQWRAYKEYGGGILCDWGAHMFDIVQWGLGMDHTGPIDWIPPNDPKAVRGLRMIYANGVEMVHEDFDRGWAVRFIGSEGNLDVSRRFLESDPENITSAQIKDSEIRLINTNENHYQDFVDAIKSRSKPICDVEVGHRSATVCNIANIAYQLNRPLKWDPVKEKFQRDSDANKLRTKKYRKGYKL